MGVVYNSIDFVIYVVRTYFVIYVVRTYLHYAGRLHRAAK